MNVSVLIPYDGADDGWRATLFQWVYSYWIRSGFETIVSDSKQRPFSRGGARNSSAKKATGDIFVVCDADTTASLAQVEAAVAQVGDRSWGFPYDVYFNLSFESTTAVLSGNDLPTEFTFEHEIHDSPAGVLVMHRDHFFEAGGYDERFQGWGYEDNAFRLAVTKIVGRPFRVAGDCFHLWHPIVPGTTFDSPTIQYNRNLYNRYAAARTEAQMRSVIYDHLHEAR